MQYFDTKPFHTNETIFKEGATGNVAYIVKEGCVEISIELDGRKTVLAVLTPVSVFGEMALLLKDHRRIATATALSYTELVEISRDAFEKFIESSPTFIKSILAALSERLHHANAKITRIPDLFLATSEILNLLFEHGSANIQYDQAVSAIANALSVDHKDIRDQLFRLEDCGLIKTMQTARGKKSIMAAKEPFLPQAMQIHAALVSVIRPSSA